MKKTCSKKSRDTVPLSMLHGERGRGGRNLMDERKKKEGNEARDLVGFLVTSTFPTVLLKRIKDRSAHSL